MSPNKRSILCVEDDKDNSDLLTYLFESEGFEVTTCGTVEECLYQALQRNFDAIILDNRLGHTTTVGACQEIRKNDPHVPIIYYSGESRPAEIEKALSECAVAYLVKPDDFEKLVPTIIKLIQEASVQVENSF
ncbi:MAG TPA: response regulator [Pyrinomonadaceae bacterium]|nr:response regulator [Pyrinomonadaceae bacterium]